MVPQRDPVGAAALAFLFQRGIAQAARGLFHTFTALAQAGNVHRDDAAGNPQPLADVRRMGGVGGRFRA